MTVQYRPARSMVAVALSLLLCAGCGKAKPADHARSEPASQPLPASALRQPGFSFHLADDPKEGTKVPATYRYTYLSASVILRDKPRVLIGFRVDPAHPDDKSEVLKSNVDGAKTLGFATTPTSAGGGAGVSFLNVGKGADGVNQYKSVVAKGSITVTINVDVDPAATGGDQAAKALHDKLLASLAFRPEGLGGPWSDAAIAPKLPVSLDVPSEIAKETYPSTWAAYYLELVWGTFTSTLGITWHDSSTAVKEFTTIRTGLDKAGVKHPGDVRTQDSLRYSLGSKVDEGLSFNLVGADKLPRQVGVIWRKDTVIVRSQSNIGEIPSSSFTADSNAALAAPMGIAKSWTWLP